MLLVECRLSQWVKNLTHQNHPCWMLWGRPGHDHPRQFFLQRLHRIGSDESLWQYKCFHFEFGSNYLKYFWHLHPINCLNVHSPPGSIQKEPVLHQKIPANHKLSQVPKFVFFSSNWINMPGVFDVEQLWPVLPPLEIPNAWNSPPAFKCKKWLIFIVDWMITAPHFNIRWMNWYEEWLIWMNATNTSKKDIEDLTRHLHCHR